MELIFGLLFVLISLIFLVRWRYNYWRNLDVPFIAATFPFGNIKGMGKKYSQFELLKDVYDKFKHNSSPIVGLYYYLSPVIMVKDMELAKNIFTRDSVHFIDRGAYYNEKDNPISAHIFNLDNPKWKTLRTKLTPTFTSGKIKMMFYTVYDVAERFVNKLKSEVDVAVDGEIEIKEFAGRFTTDVIGSVGFGLEINSLDNPTTEFRVHGINAFEKPNHSTLINIFSVAFKDLARKLHVIQVRKDIEEFFQGIVSQTVKHREDNGIVRNDFMQLMIQLKNHGKLDGETLTVGKLTMDEITAQCFIFFAAGYETSSTAMSYLLYEFANNQQVQEKARQSVRQVLAKYDNKLTYEGIKEMDYLLMCVNESLRKYPPVHTLLRYCNKDYKVENTNCTIKKGQLVIIPAYAIQHDQEYFPNPEVYDPDRFLPEEVAKRPTCAFMPFGHGPRNCIGLRFGIVQAQIGLAMLLMNFKFETCSKTVNPIEFKKFSTIMLSPIGGINLKVSKI
ncbi:cytochrome P450 6a22-like [Chironomus tepperi]|uniref:cytochrome P450 6a22-like n=1 Tax=Chironomus tepperi TaxID=113505 RepID=UPI00391F6A6B